ncbi:hypothetical protein SETIT_3G020100v2 [Setaria italica]|uniref:Uncharacterized protein n=1 Tax=Setaria italica TaxID=4555 RepID=A0A368QB67_SETIT|nr:hypothetical protein SETIT_3G020100v2 [Setaria italica]
MYGLDLSRPIRFSRAQRTPETRRGTQNPSNSDIVATIAGEGGEGRPTALAGGTHGRGTTGAGGRRCSPLARDRARGTTSAASAWPWQPSGGARGAGTRRRRGGGLSEGRRGRRCGALGTGEGYKFENPPDCHPYPTRVVAAMILQNPN